MHIRSPSDRARPATNIRLGLIALITLGRMMDDRHRSPPTPGQFINPIVNPHHFGVIVFRAILGQPSIQRIDDHQTINALGDDQPATDAIHIEPEPTQRDNIDRPSTLGRIDHHRISDAIQSIR